MKETGALKLALYIALVAALLCSATVYFVDNDFIILLVCFLVTGTGVFFSSLYLLEKFVFARINTINSRLYSSIRNEKFKIKLESAQEPPFSKLETSVHRLIHEKTTEIDNLKELERMRKEFLGDVAHELRSPIFNVQGYIHTLLEGALEDETVSKRFLEKAAKHADHLSSLVENLVTISRIEAGELKLEMTDFDLRELVTEVLELQDIVARQKGISLQLKPAQGNGFSVHADRPKIRQVLNNLVSNSIKYGRTDGATIIKLTDIGNSISVEVADNGEGIAEEHLPRIFERFYRADKSRARNQVSTGLGLAIVKHFIEAHKQKILVTSREGVGSIFSFNLAKV